MTENPQPMLDELQQVEPGYVIPVPPILVATDGPVTTQELPARLGVVADFGLVATEWTMVVGADLKRKRLTLVCDVAWRVSHSPSSGASGGGLWPASVPLVVSHASAVYARVPTGTGTLTVIPEEWAD